MKRTRNARRASKDELPSQPSQRRPCAAAHKAWLNIPCVASRCDARVSDPILCHQVLTSALPVSDWGTQPWAGRRNPCGNPTRPRTRCTAQAAVPPRAPGPNARKFVAMSCSGSLQQWSPLITMFHAADFSVTETALPRPLICNFLYCMTLQPKIFFRPRAAPPIHPGGSATVPLSPGVTLSHGVKFFVSSLLESTCVSVPAMSPRSRRRTPP